jgi:hypothetical protein
MSKFCVSTDKPNVFILDWPECKHRLAIDVSNNDIKFLIDDAQCQIKTKLTSSSGSESGFSDTKVTETTCQTYPCRELADLLKSGSTTGLRVNVWAAENGLIMVLIKCNIATHTGAIYNSAFYHTDELKIEWLIYPDIEVTLERKTYLSY